MVSQSSFVANDDANNDEEGHSLRRRRDNEGEREEGEDEDEDEGSGRSFATTRRGGKPELLNSPGDVLQAVYGLGQHKSHESYGVLCLQAFLAGIYKSVACQLYLTVGGGVVGGLLFPVGLIAILLTGAELFTSDALFMVTSFLGGQIRFWYVVRNMTLSWIFNFFGALFWAGIMTYYSGQLEDAGQVEFAVYQAEKKALQPFYQIFLKGMGANFLIGLAVWQSTTARVVAGKVLAIYFPVVTFVLIGFDHCVANMYWIPLGMWYGAQVSIVQLLFLALLPATLGNLVGGSVGMGLVYWYLNDDFASQQQLWDRLGQAMQVSQWW